MRPGFPSPCLPCAALAMLVATGCGSTYYPQPTVAPALPPRASSAATPPATVTADFSPSERERIHRVAPWVRKASAQHRVDPTLINAVIWVESRFDPRAKSSAGARGLMQLMPATAAALARRMGAVRPRSYDPEFNITAGTLYLARLLKKYKGNSALALAAYNAGSGNVDKWIQQGALPPRSRQYVELVRKAQVRFAALQQARRSDVRLAQAPVAAMEVADPVSTTPEPQVLAPATPAARVEAARAVDVPWSAEPPMASAAPTKPQLDRPRTPHNEPELSTADDSVESPRRRTRARNQRDVPTGPDPLPPQTNDPAVPPRPLAVGPGLLPSILDL